MGFRFASTLPTSKTTGITQQALSKAIGKNVIISLFGIIYFLDFQDFEIFGRKTSSKEGSFSRIRRFTTL